MKKANVQTDTYMVGAGFMVDIVRAERGFEAWIYHVNYGVKDLMFGTDKYDRDAFMEMTESVLDEHVSLYKARHMERKGGNNYG